MHIGLGLEFRQMPILAEGLAEAAVVSTARPHGQTTCTRYTAR